MTITVSILKNGIYTDAPCSCPWFCVAQHLKILVQHPMLCLPSSTSLSVSLHIYSATILNTAVLNHSQYMTIPTHTSSLQKVSEAPYVKFSPQDAFSLPCMQTEIASPTNLRTTLEFTTRVPCLFGHSPHLFYLSQCARGLL